MIRKLWSDEAGFVVSSELVLIATVLVIGLLAGLATLRDQVVQELGDVAAAISDVNQSYSFSAITAHTSSTAGTVFDDTTDLCDANGEPTDAEPNCIDVVEPATAGE